jgi:hypothetical protein
MSTTVVIKDQRNKRVHSRSPSPAINTRTYKKLILSVVPSSVHVPLVAKKIPPPPPPRTNQMAAVSPVLSTAASLPTFRIPPGIQIKNTDIWMASVEKLILQPITCEMITVPDQRVVDATAKITDTDAYFKSNMHLQRQLNELADLQGAIRRALAAKINSIMNSKARTIALHKLGR